MRRKRFAVKILVYLTFAVWLGGVVFLIGYRARNPVDGYSNSQSQERPTQEPVASFQQYDPHPRREQADVYQSYASKVFEPITLLTFFLVIGVGITAYIYWRQLREMQKTVAAVGGQGKTMEGQLAAMEWQAEIFEIQAGLFDKQVKAMQDQLATMERQEKITGDALVISNRASVGVHSIEWNKQSETILVKIENIGLVPAERINLVLEILAAFNLDDVSREPEADQVRGFLRFRLIDQDYGTTKLLRGNLQIARAFRVPGNFQPKEIQLIEGGRGNLTVLGRVSYEDGFLNQPRQETAFIFFYNPEGNFWTAGAPDRLSAHFDMMGPADNESWGNENQAEQVNPS